MTSKYRMYSGLNVFFIIYGALVATPIFAMNPPAYNLDESEICKEMAFQRVVHGPDALSFEDLMKSPRDEFFEHKRITPETRGQLSYTYHQMKTLFPSSGNFTTEEAAMKCTSLLGEHNPSILSIERELRLKNGTDDMSGYAFSLQKAKSTLMSIEKKELCVSDAQSVDSCSSFHVITIPPAINLFLNKFSSYAKNITAGDKPYDEADCECLEKKVNKVTTTTELAPETAAEKKKLEDVVYRASSRKTLNKLASVMEDLRYFGGTEAEIMAYKGSEKISEDERLCLDPAGFKKEVDELCKKNGMADGREKRMSEVLGSLNPAIRKLGFDKALSEFNKDLGVLDVLVTENGVQKKVKFDRLDYDRARRTMGKQDHQLELSNQIITEILNNSVLNKLLLKDSNYSPISSLMEMLDPDNDSARDEVDKILSKIMDKSSLKKREALHALITSRSHARENFSVKTKYSEEITNLFHIAQTTSPGFKNLLQDRNLFNKTRKDFNPKDPAHQSDGLLGVMNSNKKDLMDKLASRCKESQKELAMTVCTPTEKMLANAKTADVATLIRKDEIYKNEKGDKNAMNMAICSLYQNTPETGSPFRHLVVDEQNLLNVSDYYDSRFNRDAQKNGFNALATILQNKAAADKLKDGFKYTSSGVHTLDRFQQKSESEFNQFAIASHANKFTPHQNIAPVQGSVESSISREVASVKNFETPDFVDSKPAQSFALNSPTTAATAAAPIQHEVKSEKEEGSGQNMTREKLYKDVMTSENKDRVRDHISSLSDKDAEEIYRLRDQAKKDSEIISQLRIDQERLKAEAMRAQYDDLKAKYETLEKTNSAPAVSHKVQTSNSTGGATHESSVPQFESISNKAPISQNMNGPAGGHAMKPSALSSGQINDSSGGSSNAVGSGAAAHVVATAGSGASELRGLALTVTQLTGADGKASHSEDPNKVLINYLSKNEPSVQQLQDLKNLGLVLTEEDVSKDGQKISVKKTIKYNELSSEAKIFVEKKLAEVKMLAVKRSYSRQVLLLELFNSTSKNSNHNVKKAGSLHL